MRTASFRESAYNYTTVFWSPPETSVLSTPPLGWRISYDVGIIPAEMFNRYELELHTRNCNYQLYQELIATPIRQKSQRYGKWIFGWLKVCWCSAGRETPSCNQKTDQSKNIPTNTFPSGERSNIFHQKKTQTLGKIIFQFLLNRGHLISHQPKECVLMGKSPQISTIHWICCMFQLVDSPPPNKAPIS